MAVSPSSRTSESTFRRILEVPTNQCRLQAGDTRFDLPVTEITIGGCLICHSLPAWSDHNISPVTPSELLSIDLQLSHFIIYVHHFKNSLVYIGFILSLLSFIRDTNSSRIANQSKPFRRRRRVYTFFRKSLLRTRMNIHFQNINFKNKLQMSLYMDSFYALRSLKRV